MPLEPTGAIDSEPGTFRVLCFLREFYPTSRVDVEALFAQHLAARGHRIDLVQQAASRDIAPGMYVWHNARAFAGATVPGQGASPGCAANCLNSPTVCVFCCGRNASTTMPYWCGTRSCLARSPCQSLA